MYLTRVPEPQKVGAASREGENPDHVYFVHPSTDISVNISTDSRPMYQSAYQPSVDQTYRSSVGRYMSTEMCRSIYRPTYRSSIGQYVD